MHIAVISARRPARVPEMNRHLGPLGQIARWYVRDEQDVDDYLYAGAGDVFAAGDLVSARNLALEEAFRADSTCVQLSDDLTGIDYAPDPDRKSRITLPLAIQLLSRFVTPECPLVGAAATDNMFFRPKYDVSSAAFIIGDLMVIGPTRLRFDAALRLKEDLELSIAMLKEYGKVARVNTILPGFQHRTNGGGVVDYRTAELEQESIAYIMAKHPGYVILNKRRENEILLKWPPKMAEVVA